MNIHEMTEPECRAMLARRNVARLACARNNQPYIVPIRVDLEGDYLYGYATLGQKIEWMRENPLVCLESEEFNTDRQWASVVVLGHYEELSNTAEYAGLRGLAEHLFQSHPMWWEPAAVPLAAREQRPRIVFRIRIGRMTGRRAEPDPPKTMPDHVIERGGSHWLTQVLRRALRRRTVAGARAASMGVRAHHGADVVRDQSACSWRLVPERVGWAFGELRLAWRRNGNWRCKAEKPSPDDDPSQWGYPVRLGDSRRPAARLRSGQGIGSSRACIGIPWSATRR